MSQASDEASEVRALRSDMQNLTVQVTRVVAHFDHWAPVWGRQSDGIVDLSNRNTKLEARVHELEQQKKSGWDLKLAIGAAIVGPLATVVIERLLK